MLLCGWRLCTRLLVVVVVMTATGVLPVRYAAALEPGPVVYSVTRSYWGSMGATMSRDGRRTFFQVSDSQAGYAVRTTDLGDPLTSSPLTANGQRITISLDTPNGIGGTSGNGRYVAFMSGGQYSPFVPETSGFAFTPYVLDRVSGTVEVVGATASGASFPTYVGNMAISADGRWVAFTSHWSPPGDPNPRPGYYVWRWDRVTKVLRRIAATRTDVQSCWASVCPPRSKLDISDDGNRIVLVSGWDDLTPGDTNGRHDLFVADVHEGTFRRLPADDSGDMTLASGSDLIAGFSADGRTIATRRFESTRWVVYLHGADGSVRRLLDPSGSDLVTDDGAHIVFVRTYTDALSRTWIEVVRRRIADSREDIVYQRRSFPQTQERGIFVTTATPNGDRILFSDEQSGGSRVATAGAAAMAADPVATFPSGDVNKDGLVRWAVLGDSYMSGEGLTKPAADESNGNVDGYDPSTDGGVNECHRARTAWGIRVATRFGSRGEDLMFAACSGATTAHVINRGQFTSSPADVHGGLAQSAVLRDFDKAGAADVVFLGIGGNDANFAKQIESCIASTLSCDPAKEPALDSVARNVVAALRSVRAAAPAARLMLATYPMPFDAESPACGSRLNIGAEELRRAGEYVSKLNEALAEAALLAGAFLLDIEDVFEGREVCSDEALVHGLSAGINHPRFSLAYLVPAFGNLAAARDLFVAKESFHPSDEGHQVIASAVAGDVGDALAGRAPVDSSSAVAWEDISAGLVLNTDGHRLHVQFISDGTPVLVGEYSVPTVLARIEAPAGELVELSLDRGSMGQPHPGMHVIELRDQATGQRIDSSLFYVSDDTNCPAGPDADGDRWPDECDPDSTDGPAADVDGDAVANRQDNCPAAANPAQVDTDNDGLGDVCDADSGGLPTTGWRDAADDVAAPVVTARPDGIPGNGGWWRSDVSVAWDAVDPAPSVGPVVAPPPVTVSGDGASQRVESALVCDLTMRCSHGETFVSIDSRPPSISAEVPEGWITGDHRVEFACADATSGVATCAAPHTFPADGTHAVTAHADDVAGNQATVSFGPYLVDRTSPAISGVPTTAPTLGGWWAAPVTVQSLCADVTSGVATCPDPVVLGAGETATVTATDVAGNVRSVTYGPYPIDADTPTVARSSGPVIVRMLGHSLAGTAIDGTSGVGRVTVKLGDTEFSSLTGAVTLNCDSARQNCEWRLTEEAVARGRYAVTLVVHDRVGRSGVVAAGFVVIV